MKYLLLAFTGLGFVVFFFVGGGMSMVDGLTPAWKDYLAISLGFLANLPITYFFLIFAVHLYGMAKGQFFESKPTR